MTACWYLLYYKPLDHLGNEDYALRHIDKEYQSGLRNDYLRLRWRLVG
jgi:hypothetical protein